MEPVSWTAIISTAITVISVIIGFIGNVFHSGKKFGHMDTKVNHLNESFGSFKTETKNSLSKVKEDLTTMPDKFANKEDFRELRQKITNGMSDRLTKAETEVSALREENNILFKKKDNIAERVAKLEAKTDSSPDEGY